MFGYTTFAQAPYASLGGNSFTSSLSESAAAAAALSTVIGRGGLINESATATDTPTAVRTLLVSLAETAAGSDAPTVQVAFVGTVSESANGSDLSNAIATINASVTGVQLYVLEGNVLVWQRIDDSQTPNWQSINNTQNPGWTDIPV